MSTLYEIIELLCKDAGTNVTQMCKETGVGRSTLSELKAGRTKTLSFDVASKIANYFNVPLSFFEIDDYAQPSDLLGKRMLANALKSKGTVVEAEIKEKKPLHGTKDFFRELFSDLTESEVDDLTKYARFLRYLRDHPEV